MKRKVLGFTLIISIIASLFVTMPITSNAETNGIYTYIIENGEVTITGCDESVSGELRIPAFIEGYPVKNIGDGAFESRTDLTLLYIPKGVTNIGDRAFLGCTGITHIILNFGIKSIGDEAFRYCDNVKTVVYNAHEEFWNVVSIGENNDCLTNGKIDFWLAVIRGDSSGDGIIDVRDIISLRRFLAGGYNTVVSNRASDANRDDTVDASDIIALRRYLAGGYGVKMMEDVDESGSFRVAGFPDSWSELLIEDDKVTSVKDLQEAGVELDVELFFPVEIIDPKEHFFSKTGEGEWSYIIWE